MKLRYFDRGYSLLELLVVLAIIGIVAGLAIPNMLTSRRAANEAAAVSFLRNLVTAQATMKATKGSFASDFAELESEKLLEDPGASRLGYSFSMRANEEEWVCIADPVTVGETGTRYFFVDETGVIRVSLESRASSSSPPLGADS